MGLLDVFNYKKLRYFRNNIFQSNPSIDRDFVYRIVFQPIYLSVVKYEKKVRH